MIVTKRYLTGSNHIKLYKYLLGVEATELPNLNDFLAICRKGHVLLSKMDDGIIIGGSLTYETKDRYFVAHCHIDKIFRNTKVFVSYYAKIQTWTQKSDKPVYTKLKDLTGVEKLMTKVHGNIYEIDKEKKLWEV